MTKFKMLKTPGDLIEEGCSNAQYKVILVAPYMKSAVVERLIGRIPDVVTNIVFITRWKPGDVAHRVSDLEVFDIVAGREGGRLLLHPSLHAKYFRFDQRRLIGSANLTMTALGWHFPPNLEILTPANTKSKYLDAFEQELLEYSVPATAELREKMAEAAAAIEVVRGDVPSYESPVDPRYGILGWLPRSPEIEVIWRVYRGENVDDVIESARNAARYDLAALAIPSGLPEDRFWINVQVNFSLMPLVDKIAAMAKEGLDQGRGQEIISNYTALDGRDADGYDPSIYWDIIQHWLVALFPGKYRVMAASSVFAEGNVID